MDPGAIGALFAVALGRAAGGRLVREIDLGEGGVLQQALANAVDAGVRSIDGPVRGWIEALLPERRRQRLLQSATWLDLAGLAWAEALAVTDEAELHAIFGVAAPRVRARLDAPWFVDILLNRRARELGFALGGHDPRLGLPDALVAALVAYLIDETALHLDREYDDDEVVEAFLAEVVAGLPDRIARMFMQLPGREAVLTRLAAERSAVALDEVIARLDGTAAGREALTGLAAMAQALVRLVDQDTFRRASFDDLPILVHREVYVEPDATGTVGRLPAKSAVARAWERHDLVVLQAPFGMGKSLTCRELAAELASAWLADPEEAPCPLLLECPELLQGNVASLQMAVLRHLEEQGLPTDAARWVWERAPLVVILDSFDEVVLHDGEAERWMHDIAALSRRPRVRVLLATRPHGVQRGWLGDRAEVLDLEQLTDAQAQRWLDVHAAALTVPRRSFGEVVDRLDDELARTPILLLMALVVWDSPLDLIPGRAGLFASFLDRLSTGKWEGVQAPHPAIVRGGEALGADDGARLYREALARVAWAHKVGVDDARSGLPVRRLEEALERWHPNLKERHRRELERAVVLSLFFRKGEGDRDVRFTHRAFRDFLCARYLLAQLKWECREPTSRAFLLAMAEAPVGRAEANFLRELLVGEPPELRALALRHADAAIERPRIVLLDEDEVRAETWGQRRTVYTASPHRQGPQGSVVVRSSGRALSSRLRGHRREAREAFDGRWWVLDDHLIFDKNDGRVAVWAAVAPSLQLDARWDALALGDRPRCIEQEAGGWLLSEPGLRLDGDAAVHKAFQWQPLASQRLALTLAVGRHLARHPEAQVAIDPLLVCVLPRQRWCLVPGAGQPDPDDVRRAWARYALTALNLPGLERDPDAVRLGRLLAGGHVGWLPPLPWDALLDDLEGLAHRLEEP